MFSATELEAFIDAMNAASDTTQCRGLFVAALSSTPKNSPRRYSFLHRLSQSVGRFHDFQAEVLACAIAENCAEYVYDIFLPTAAEAGRGLLFVFEVVERFSKTATIQRVLENALKAAADDTFAVRLLSFSGVRREQNKIVRDFSNVDANSLEEVFVARMESRYGPKVDAMKVNLAQGDREAFGIWVNHSDRSRDVEIQFWRRFIGGGRKRLAMAVDFLFPAGLWTSDPQPFVDRLFPLGSFKELAERLPVDGELTESENRALGRS